MATKKNSNGNGHAMPTVKDVYARVVKALKLKPDTDETASAFRKRVEVTIRERWALIKGDERRPMSSSLLRKLQSSDNARTTRRPKPDSCPQFYKDLARYFHVDPMDWYRATPPGRDRGAE